MGNICNRSSDKKKQNTTIKQIPYKRTSTVSSDTNIWSRIRSSSSSSSRRENVKVDDYITYEEALAIVREQQRNGSMPFDRSSSLRYSTSSNKHHQRQKQVNSLPRSSSSRPRSSTDTLIQPQQLFNQEATLNDRPPCHFVFVHGGGFGAWCWYKTITLLEENGFEATAIDLAGSGIHSLDSNEITSFSQYVKPLTEFLQKLADDDKVVTFIYFTI
ncbi:hypothetical protein RND81_10G061900 [Saponaria officinalis]|uniref:Uncharacterized protein n=1 Tax=Saponaria officinalis TaxID=3572 RepID=A0AAW1HZA1_SAPOF